MTIRDLTRANAASRQSAEVGRGGSPSPSFSSSRQVSIRRQHSEIRVISELWEEEQERSKCKFLLAIFAEAAILAGCVLLAMTPWMLYTTFESNSTCEQEEKLDQRVEDLVKDPESREQYGFWIYSYRSFWRAVYLGLLSWSTILCLMLGVDGAPLRLVIICQVLAALLYFGIIFVGYNVCLYQCASVTIASSVGRDVFGFFLVCFLLVANGYALAWHLKLERRPAGDGREIRGGMLEDGRGEGEEETHRRGGSRAVSVGFHDRVQEGGGGESDIELRAERAERQFQSTVLHERPPLISSLCTEEKEKEDPSPLRSVSELDFSQDTSREVPSRERDIEAGTRETGVPYSPKCLPDPVHTAPPPPSPGPPESRALQPWGRTGGGVSLLPSAVLPSEMHLHVHFHQHHPEMPPPPAWPHPSLPGPLTDTRRPIEQSKTRAQKKTQAKRQGPYRPSREAFRHSLSPTRCFHQTQPATRNDRGGQQYRHYLLGKGGFDHASLEENRSGSSQSPESDLLSPREEEGEIDLGEGGHGLTNLRRSSSFSSSAQKERAGADVWRHQLYGQKDSDRRQASGKVRAKKHSEIVPNRNHLFQPPQRGLETSSVSGRERGRSLEEQERGQHGFLQESFGRSTLAPSGKRGVTEKKHATTLSVPSRRETTAQNLKMKQRHTVNPADRGFPPSRPSSLPPLPSFLFPEAFSKRPSKNKEQIEEIDRDGSQVRLRRVTELPDCLPFPRLSLTEVDTETHHKPRNHIVCARPRTTLQFAPTSLPLPLSNANKRGDMKSSSSSSSSETTSVLDLPPPPLLVDQSSSFYSPTRRGTQPPRVSMEDAGRERERQPQQSQFSSEDYHKRRATTPPQTTASIPKTNNKGRGSAPALFLGGQIHPDTHPSRETSPLTNVPVGAQDRPTSFPSAPRPESQQAFPSAHLSAQGGGGGAVWETEGGRERRRLTFPPHLGKRSSESYEKDRRGTSPALISVRGDAIMNVLPEGGKGTMALDLMPVGGIDTADEKRGKRKTVLVDVEAEELHGRERESMGFTMRAGEEEREGPRRGRERGEDKESSEGNDDPWNGPVSLGSRAGGEYGFPAMPGDRFEGEGGGAFLDKRPFSFVDRFARFLALLFGVTILLWIMPVLLFPILFDPSTEDFVKVALRFTVYGLQTCSNIAVQMTLLNAPELPIHRSFMLETALIAHWEATHRFIQGTLSSVWIGILSEILAVCLELYQHVFRRTSALWYYALVRRLTSCNWKKGVDLNTEMEKARSVEYFQLMKPSYFVIELAMALATPLLMIGMRASTSLQWNWPIILLQGAIQLIGEALADLLYTFAPSGRECAGCWRGCCEGLARFCEKQLDKPEGLPDEEEGRGGREERKTFQRRKTRGPGMPLGRLDSRHHSGEGPGSREFEEDEEGKEDEEKSVSKRASRMDEAGRRPSSRPSRQVTFSLEEEDDLEKKNSGGSQRIAGPHKHTFRMPAVSDAQPPSETFVSSDRARSPPFFEEPMHSKGRASLRGSFPGSAHAPLVQQTDQQVAPPTFQETQRASVTSVRVAELDRHQTNRFSKSSEASFPKRHTTAASFANEVSSDKERRRQEEARNSAPIVAGWAPAQRRRQTEREGGEGHGEERVPSSSPSRLHTATFDEVRREGSPDVGEEEEVEEGESEEDEEQGVIIQSHALTQGVTVSDDEDEEEEGEEEGEEASSDFPPFKGPSLLLRPHERIRASHSIARTETDNHQNEPPPVLSFSGGEGEDLTEGETEIEMGTHTHSHSVPPTNYGSWNAYPPSVTNRHSSWNAYPPSVTNRQSSGGPLTDRDREEAPGFRPPIRFSLPTAFHSAESPVDPISHSSGGSVAAVGRRRGNLLSVEYSEQLGHSGGKEESKVVKNLRRRAVFDNLCLRRNEDGYKFFGPCSQSFLPLT
uniref:Transmembrane protein n=1 Tax=Chromera velia CCMP2878 TaxID=1169474 RepID=A0A0K6SAN4_9ALVE|eukprot:Cvel_10480.t2-p1 / transcript=Cvel_10480.t2 / gene=Cvel_10480 / organism=Chromera_velia_CCMP2878 / gene_product=hypothetical protein / transcript_product=hypothetical protein / location=Cvel_scaffold632:49746-58451(+) / protein_length=1905 / sequence_SO=supercontig / SO=protein_coding / is_pseudo=false